MSKKTDFDQNTKILFKYISGKILQCEENKENPHDGRYWFPSSFKSLLRKFKNLKYPKINFILWKLMDLELLTMVKEDQMFRFALTAKGRKLACTIQRCEKCKKQEGSEIYWYREEIADDIGVIPALLYELISFLCATNKIEGKGFMCGKHFCNISIKSISNYYPMLSMHEIQYYIKKLEEKDYIQSVILSEEDKYTHAWYTTTGKVADRNKKLRYLYAEVMDKAGIDAAAVFYYVEQRYKENDKVHYAYKTIGKHTHNFSVSKVKKLINILVEKELITRISENPKILRMSKYLIPKDLKTKKPEVTLRL